jgi:precorrin-6B methylase 2
MTNPGVLLILLLILLALLLAALVLWVGYAVFFMLPMLRGPVFVPTTDEKMEIMFKLAALKKGEVLADLGSGDGKLVIEAARRGFTAHGYEINPWLVWQSRRQIRTLGLEQKAKIFYQSLWKADLSQYDVVMLYGTTYIMKSLEKKLKRELKKKARFVSNYFQLPNWKPVKKIGDVYLFV